MLAPYEYRRSQTLASKFACSTLTEWRIKKYVILSVSEISHVLSEKVQTLRKFTLPGDCFAPLAKTVKLISLSPSGKVSAKPTIGDLTSYWASAKYLTTKVKKYIYPSVLRWDSSLRSEWQKTKKIRHIVKQNPSLCLKQGVSGMWRRPILPDSCPSSTFGAAELNFCVRDEYRWILCAIATTMAI